MKRALLLLLTAISSGLAVWLWLPNDPNETLVVRQIQKNLETVVVINVKTVVPMIEIKRYGNGHALEISTKAVSVSGAGVYISSRGSVLTCEHLFFGDIQEITATDYYGNSWELDLLGRSLRQDLALLRSEARNVRYARVEWPGRTKVGQEVWAIGHPFGLTYTVTKGIVSATNRDQYRYNMTQFDVAINPGNSGGPVFNRAGNIVGIVSGHISENRSWSGITMTTSVEQIREFLVRFRRGL